MVKRPLVYNFEHILASYCMYLFPPLFSCPKPLLPKVMAFSGVRFCKHECMFHGSAYSFFMGRDSEDPLVGHGNE